MGPGPNGKFANAYGADKSYQGGAYLYSTGSCGKDCSFNIYHALAWNGSGSKPVDITPPLVNFAMAWVDGGAGTALVGYGITNNGGYYGTDHALLWRGAAYAWTDLNPPGYSESRAYGIGSGTIVGSGTSSALHALMWPLTDVNAPVDLHPGSAYLSSEALGAGGTKQVGYAQTSSSTPTQHAILWSGTAASAVDLTPSNVTRAYAYAVDSTGQAGCGVVAPATASHALLWKGTAASMKDVNPPGFTSSCVRAVRNGVEAGYGQINGYTHALVWAGTAKSAIDLQLSMPSGYYDSQAYAIDAAGNIVGSAYSGAAPYPGWHGAMWLRQ